MPSSDEILQQYIKAHGGLKGNAYPIDPQIDQYDEATGKTGKVPNPDPTYHYEFADGTSLDMNGSGQIKTSAETKPPTATANNDRPGYQSYTDASGNLYESWSGHPWSIAKDASGNPIRGHVPGTTDTTTRAPSDPSKWVEIKGPDGKTLALQDPVTGDRVAVPAGPARKSGTEDSVSGGYVFHWSYDDQGNPHLTGKDQIADPNKIPDGTKTYINQGGWGIPAVYKNGTAIPTGEQATPLTPETAAVPKEGDRRPGTLNGMAIQQVYSGGSWVTDTSVKPTQFTPQPVQQANAPATEKNLTTYDPNTGTYSQTPNQNYQPGDVAGKVQQLQQQAQAKRDELNKAVQSGQKTGEQAAAEFDQWWNSNVEPQKAQLQQAQQTQQTDATIKQNTELRNQQAAEQSAFTTAQGAGRDAVAAAQAGLANRVGPGFGAALNNIQQAYSSGKAPGKFDIGSAVTYDMPDFSKISEQATAQALAHLSPTAAGKMGLPMPGIPQGMDISGALNKSNYAPTTTIAPDGTVTITHAQPGGYQGAPNPNIFGSGTGNVMQPLPPALAPNEQQMFGNYTPPG